MSHDQARLAHPLAPDMTLWHLWEFHPAWSAAAHAAAPDNFDGFLYALLGGAL